MASIRQSLFVRIFAACVVVAVAAELLYIRILANSTTRPISEILPPPDAVQTITIRPLYPPENSILPTVISEPSQIDAVMRDMNSAEVIPWSHFKVTHRYRLELATNSGSAKLATAITVDSGVIISTLDGSNRHYHNTAFDRLFRELLSNAERARRAPFRTP